VADETFTRHAATSWWTRSWTSSVAAGLHFEHRYSGPLLLLNRMHGFFGLALDGDSRPHDRYWPFFDFYRRKRKVRVW